MQVILGLGTNQGDRHAHLMQAITAIADFASDIVCSPIYESKALLPENAPESWDSDFLNMAVACHTTLSPRELLLKVKVIETALGRTKTGHWGPREIDIDILAYANMTVNEADLIIPHALLLERDFALVPFADIAPDWVYPVAGTNHGQTAKRLARRFESNSLKQT